MILYKTYNGQTVSVLRDAVPSDPGYDNSPASTNANSYQQLVQDQTGHVFVVPKSALSGNPLQQWPTVPASSSTPEHWP